MQSNTPLSSAPVSNSNVPSAEPPRGSRGQPDAGSPAMALWALLATIVFFLIVLVSQQINVLEHEATKPDPSATKEVTVFDLAAKGFTKGFGAAFKEADEASKSQALKPVTESIRDLAYTPNERLKTAISAGELAGADHAVSELEAAPKWVDEQIAANRADTKKGFELKETDRAKFDETRELLLRHYRSKLPENKDQIAGPKPLTDAELKTLNERLDWFGRLAAVYGNKDAPDRASLFAGSEALVVMFLLIAVGMFCAAIAGIVLFFVAAVMLISGKLTFKFVPPSPGGSVYIEAVAVFILGFIALKFATMGLEIAFAKNPPEWLGTVHLLLQWVLAILPLYPIVRGVSFSQWKQQVGFVAPKGVAREIGAGILAYFASLPIFFIGIAISLVLKLILDMIQRQFGAEQSGPITNPIFDLVISSNPINLILLVSLVTLWAPFVEEMIFRGSLYRHLRSRMGLLLAGILSALVFGGMHGYELVMLGPVISLGFVFAMMREWRGSIIPSITAHMLHNGTVIIMVITMIKLINK